MFSLILNIPFGDFFIGVLSYCVEIESGYPEIASPKHLFDFGISQEYLLCADWLYCSNRAWRLHSGYCLDKEVDMIFISANFNKVYFISLCDLQTSLFKGFGNFWTDGFATILYWEYCVVQKQSFVVWFNNVLAHSFSLPYILTRRRASRNSDGIKSEIANSGEEHLLSTVIRNNQV